MKKSTKSAGNNFRSIDFIVVIILSSLAAVSIALFRFDLFQTFTSRNQEPVGTVIVRRNTVQRRLSDRVLWDRLTNESPVYIGDLIRVADLSSATLNINDNSIEINENTLIRISLAADGETLQITLTEGNLSLSSQGTSGFILDLNGHQIQASAGTVLNAAAGTDGISLEVNEGNVLFGTGEDIREIASGSIIAMDTSGNEVIIRTAVVTSPSPVMRYLSSSGEPLPVEFAWNRINLLPEDTLRLEAAFDRSFNRIYRSIDGLNNSARVYFEPGLWHWRLLLEDDVLSEGRIIVADGTGPQLHSPALSSIYRITDEVPVITFQWEDTEEASSYILEISGFTDFINPQIQIQTESPFFATTALSEGTWYWRVRSVFPAVYRGSSSFSPASFFSIEQSVPEITETASLEEWLAAEIPPQLIPASPPVLNLISPAQGTNIEGLTALRQQIILNWECDAEIVNSRFVLSREPDPFEGSPFRTVINPSASIIIERLSEGTYYWNVEAETADGFTVRAAENGIFHVLAIPLLPSPQVIQPARGTRFGMNELRGRRDIQFRWQPVQGANAYIFSLHQQTAGGLRQIINPVELRVTSYTLNNLRLLDRGTFIWRIEAINRGSNNSIEQRGVIGENTFVLDFPSPTPVQIENFGTLYGN